MSSSSKPSTTTNAPLAGKLLLSLPQSDLVAKSSSSSSSSSSKLKTSHVGSSSNSRPRRADLVLFQVPEMYEDIVAGNCQILANNQSASLVVTSNCKDNNEVSSSSSSSKTKSVQLVTVGTSNSLVVWKQEQHRGRRNGGDGEENTTNNNNSSNKRVKAAIPCRLIQPGGSGASFLVGQSNPINRQEVLSMFESNNNNKTTGNNIGTPTKGQHSQQSPLQRSYTTTKLANLFQCSEMEMEELLSQIPTIVSFDLHRKDQQQVDATSTTVTSTYWQSIPEEEVLYGQQALVQTLVEEDDDDNDNDTEDGRNNVFLTLRNLTNKVSERLLPLLLDHESEHQDHHPQQQASSSRAERSKAIARQTILLSETPRSSKSSKMRHPNHCRIIVGGGSSTLKNKSIRIDPNIIAFYVLRDLFLNRSSYSVGDCISKWSTRLPFGDKYESIVVVMDDDDDDDANGSTSRSKIHPTTMEWLKDHQIIPNQLVIVDDDDDGTTTGTSHSHTNTNPDRTTVSLLRLVTPGSVLEWHA